MVSGFIGLKVSLVWIYFGQFMDANKELQQAAALATQAANQKAASQRWANATKNCGLVDGDDIIMTKR